MKVEDIMTRDVLTVEPDTPIGEVATSSRRTTSRACPSATRRAACSESCRGRHPLQGIRPDSGADAACSRCFPTVVRPRRAASASSDRRRGHDVSADHASGLRLGREAARLMSEHRGTACLFSARRSRGHRDPQRSSAGLRPRGRRHPPGDRGGRVRRNLWLEDPGAVVVDVERGAIRASESRDTKRAQALERLAAKCRAWSRFGQS